MELVEHEGRWIFVASREYVDRSRRIGFVTPNGVVYRDELAGSAGATFILVRDAHTTDADLDDAAAYLRLQRDVVGAIREAGVAGQTIPTETRR